MRQLEVEWTTEPVAVTLDRERTRLGPVRCRRWRLRRDRTRGPAAAVDRRQPARQRRCPAARQPDRRRRHGRPPRTRGLREGDDELVDHQLLHVEQRQLVEFEFELQLEQQHYDLFDDQQQHNKHDTANRPRWRRDPCRSGNPHPLMPQDSLIAGRYRLLGKLGSGGMSTVRLAVDERLERQVAVKLLAEHLADDPAFVSRFRHEAVAAARLVHPNIVQVFDSGLDEESHRHFIVMEYVEGSSCAELLRDRGRLPAEEVARIAADSAEGLDYAHRNGVIHRDVKPGNLLVSDSGRVKLADFGIAKATEQSSVTQVGSVLGTAAYLAPEQARGEEADPRCDIYALGVVAYQLTAGRLPYDASSLSELALKQQSEHPPRLDELDPSVPAWFADAVASALALDRDRRPEDAGAFAALLRGGSPAGQPTSATRVLTGAATAAGAAGPRTTVAQPISPRPPRESKQSGGTEPTASSRSKGLKRLGALLAAIVLLAAGAGTAVVLTQPKGSDPQLREVIGSNADQAIQSMRDLVESNTK